MPSKSVPYLTSNRIAALAVVTQAGIEALRAQTNAALDQVAEGSQQYNQWERARRTREASIKEAELAMQVLTRKYIEKKPHPRLVTPHPGRFGHETGA